MSERVVQRVNKVGVRKRGGRREGGREVIGGDRREDRRNGREIVRDTGGEIY